MGVVVGLDGGPPPTAVTGEPNAVLIETLERVLEMARQGRLQSFIGTGFLKEGDRLAVFGPNHPNVYEMLGALGWLEHEYVARTTGDIA